MEKSFYKTIKNIKNDISEIELLISKFNPLLKKYSSILNLNGYDYNDAYQDLCLHLIEVINKLPLNNFDESNTGALINYIALSIRNKYIFISKKNQLNSYKNLQLQEFDNISYSTDWSNLILKDLFNILNYNQRKIMTLSYLYLLSDSEIALILNKSRQAVNRSKNCALNKIKHFLLKGDG